MPPLPVLVALADPTRCRIIEILRDGPQPVHILAGSFDISRPAISRHLRVLKQAKLISEKKVGRENRYALHANRLRPVRDWLGKFDVAAKAPGKAVMSKPAASAVAPKPAAAVVPQAVATPPVAPKLAPEKPVSQMGFDF